MQSIPGVLLEADIVAQVVSFMEHRGWRAIRNQRTVIPGSFSTCEPGMPDNLFIYYFGKHQRRALTLCVWVEFKKKGARAKCRCLTKKARQRCTSCDQRHWAKRERARGATVWTSVDDLEWFIEQYELAFSFLHSGELATGQLDLLAGVSV